MGPGKVAAAVRSDLGLDCRRLALALPELLAAALSVREVNSSSQKEAAFAGGGGQEDGGRDGGMESYVCGVTRERMSTRVRNNNRRQGFTAHAWTPSSSDALEPLTQTSEILFSTTLSNASLLLILTYINNISRLCTRSTRAAGHVQMTTAMHAPSSSPLRSATSNATNQLTAETSSTRYRTIAANPDLIRARLRHRLRKSCCLI